MKTQPRLSAETTAQGNDKNTLYNWTIRNAPGEFLMIHKNELEVDPAYQRNRINQRRVDALTRTWDWIACGCLVVALRDDNKWFVMDSQPWSMNGASASTASSGWWLFRPLRRGLNPWRAPSCFPSRQNTVESRSSEKPALGQASSRGSQRQSGRQTASMWAWENRRKKLRMVSSPGKRSTPSKACRT